MKFTVFAHLHLDYDANCYKSVSTHCVCAHFDHCTCNKVSRDHKYPSSFDATLFWWWKIYIWTKRKWIKCEKRCDSCCWCFCIGCMRLASLARRSYETYVVIYTDFCHLTASSLSLSILLSSKQFHTCANSNCDTKSNIEIVHINTSSSSSSTTTPRTTASVCVCDEPLYTKINRRGGG